MESQLHKSDSRGSVEIDWLKSKHTFSFGEYYDPSRIRFGKLRVINDDIIKPSSGFATHPHDNMEIISVPVYGSLRHEDSMGNKHIINTGEIQVMSAGSGLTHSEYNNSDTEDANFLQIWVMPKQKDIEPRYGQKKFDVSDRQNKFQLVVAPDEKDGAVDINQDAYFSLINLNEGKSATYKPHDKNNGVYIFIIQGQAKTDEQQLDMRDGFGIAESKPVEIKAQKDSEILVMEVPL